MESLKHAQRPFKLQNASVNSLSGDCDYYRIRLNSEYKSSGTDAEAVYNIRQLFPNHRANLMDGEWYAYLEEFDLQGFSQWGRNVMITPDTTSHGIRVCLPDLIKPSKDFVITAADTIKPDDTLALVPKTVEIATQSHYSFEAKVDTDQNSVEVTFDDTDVDWSTVLANGQQVEIYGSDGSGLPIAATEAQKDAVADYLNDTHTITNVTDTNFTLQAAYPFATAVGPHLTDEKVYVLLPVRNGANVNTIPDRIPSIEVDDSPYQAVYRLRQSDVAVGHAINPGQLFSGQLKVALKGEDHELVKNGYTNANPHSLTSLYGFVENYEATIVFVHKKKKYST